METTVGRRLVLHVHFITPMSVLVIPGRVFVLCLEEAASAGRCMPCSASGRSVSQSVGERRLGSWESNNSISP